VESSKKLNQQTKQKRWIVKNHVSTVSFLCNTYISIGNDHISSYFGILVNDALPSKSETKNLE